MAIGAGIAAAIGVFSAIYAKAPAWGTDWTSATGLFGATFSAFVAAATAVIAAGSDKQSPKVATGTWKYPQQTVMMSDTERNRFQLGITARYPAARKYV